VPVAVCSSGWRDHVIGNLEACGALDLFTEVVTADDPDLKNGKPAPDIWLIAARRLNVPIENCVGFEDAPLGMESLQAAGVKFAADVTVWADYPRNVEARAREAAAA
jgi:pseudouridine-5'-monophosphatase